MKNITPIIADVRDQVKVEDIFKHHHPQIVFHAAAYKHVPLMEQQPDEAVRVNILGTKIVSQVAAQHSVERFVLISTDKAINPSSVMGATKRLAEQIVATGRPLTNQNGRARKPGSNGTPHPISHIPYPTSLIPHPNPTLHSPLFTAVRFGNVLDSRGSVVPTFTRQIEMGGPVTITHPDMTRYFITIPEAVSLVIQAATLTRGGDVFMLDMGQEIRIVDLAHKIIRLRGLRPNEDIPLEFIGVRPGEKLHEELLGSNETRLPTTHPKIFRIKSKDRPLNGKKLSEQVSYLVDLACAQQNDKMINLLWRLVKTEMEPETSIQWN